MSKDYIKCNCCGKKIFFGDVVYFHSQGHTYCSAECYADSWGNSAELNEELAKYNGCEIFNDEKRKIVLLREMEELTEKLAKAKFELETLQ